MRARKTRPPVIRDEHLERYFAFARERYNIFLRRQRGEAPPWTEDEILRDFRFTNVLREDDATTAWFRENIRTPLQDRPEVMLATVGFRQFNRIDVGRLLAPYLLTDNWDMDAWRSTLSAHRAAGGKIVTAAYIVRTPFGFDKLDGNLWILKEAKLRECSLLQYIRERAPEERRLEEFWSLLLKWPYLGEFTSNEVVVDLMETPVLSRALDKQTWTNPGPGCSLGIGLLLHNEDIYNRSGAQDRHTMMEVMKVFLEASRNQKYWPTNFPKFASLHQVEWLFCEVSKYIRAQQGKRPKRRYTCPVASTG